jgi:hypothetical protein
MSVVELAKVVGQGGRLLVDMNSDTRWGVPCVVVDVREVWGEVQYRVEPAGGTAGQGVWVKSYRVRLGEGVSA